MSFARKMYIMYMVIVHFLLPSFGQNFGVVNNNAFDIADTTDNQLVERLPCNDEEVFDIKMNQCVRFACPPNFKISREEYKCKLVRKPITNAAIPGQSCLDSLKAYTLNVYSYSLKRRDELGSRSKAKQTSIGLCGLQIFR